jgi:uncharacterized protein YukE
MEGFVNEMKQAGSKFKWDVERCAGACASVSHMWNGLINANYTAIVAKYDPTKSTFRKAE